LKKRKNKNLIKTREERNEKIVRNKEELIVETKEKKRKRNPR